MMAVNCSNCGHDNPAGLAVCAQCASPLLTRCPQCAFENPPTFKYCGNCGSSLAENGPAPRRADASVRQLHDLLPGQLAEKIQWPARQIEGERRTVTVL